MQIACTYMALGEGEPAYPDYSPAERYADAVLHVIGVAAALISAPVMIALAVAWYGDPTTVIAAAVYAVSLLAMLSISACYHMSRKGSVKRILRRLDHAAIYVKIAGTYTPFAVLLAGEHAAAILAGTWTAALIGLALKLTVPQRIEKVSLVLYFAMGWAVVVIGDPILGSVSGDTYLLMVIGAALYMLGVVFFLCDWLRFHIAIWHGFVLAASFAFYAAILVEVTRHAPAM